MNEKPSIWWQRANWFFFLLMIVPAVLPLRSHYDFAFERRAAVFRVVGVFLGVAGLGMTALIKRILYPPARKVVNARSVRPPRLVMPLPGEAVVSSAPSTPAANPWDTAGRDAIQRKTASVPAPPPPDAPRFFARYQSKGFVWGIDPWSLVFRSDTRMSFFGIPAIASVLSLIITVRFSWAAVWKTVVGIWLAYAVIFLGMMVEYVQEIPQKELRPKLLRRPNPGRFVGHVADLNHAGKMDAGTNGSAVPNQNVCVLVARNAGVSHSRCFP